MDTKTRINHYWSKRADEFSDARRQDLLTDMGGKWREILKAHLPDKEVIRVLDLGTGAGFLAFLLSDLGCTVTGIDYSSAMVENAKNNAVELGYKAVDFLQMDAEKLNFPEGSFDVVVTRNVTWTLPDPQKAYVEMARILRPGGIILNFDANYGQAFRVADELGDTLKVQQELSRGSYKHPAQSIDMVRERNEIAKSLYVCDATRPLWDMTVLSRLGFNRYEIDLDIGRQVFGRLKIYGNSASATDGQSKQLPTSPMFMICAHKSLE